MRNEITRKEFLEALFDTYLKEQRGFISVKIGKHQDHNVSTRYFPNLSSLATDRFDEEQSILFGVCPRERMKPGPEYIHYLVALWSGLDLEPAGYSGRHSYLHGPAQAAKAVRSFHFPPSIVVESGHGLHLYWLLKNVVKIDDKERTESLLQRIASHFLCTNKVPLDSFLRLPGTFNSKISGQTINCRVKYLNTNFRYDLKDFEEMFLSRTPGPSPAVQHTAEPPTKRSTVVEQQIDNDEVLGAIDDLEVKEFLEQDKSRVHFSGKRPQQPAPTHARSEYTPPKLETPTNWGADVVEVVEESARDLADEVAEKVVEQLRATLVDEIVDKLIERLAKFKRP